MPDSKTEAGKIDRIRINFNESYEVNYWTKKWKVSYQQLHGAHKATDSVMVKKIEGYLREKGVI